MNVIELLRVALYEYDTHEHTRGIRYIRGTSLYSYLLPAHITENVLNIRILYYYTIYCTDTQIY